MGSQVHEFDVEMTCEGCSNAVERVLGKKTGIDNIKIDLPNKKVFVTSSLPKEEILETLKKTGKNVSYIGTQG
ncbi:copper transport protein ATOX1 [Chelonus insularis]|uniref:copper transport protein ATOX1 n=1 Tax=Chelonus insularis TaxID=460826 RepID=UPI00158ED7B2|nr:copper transport protein ATOX1 [Chelonus insularis]XP_034935330.1 copper transport protein ATOX1 [Chelonus insularis]XP_034935337.1 copper transport protein ATOX1 [Chelonus insularis]XP_034935345.1 copper transport protein ATOX1 [Chelonus insularis]